MNGRNLKTKLSKGAARTHVTAAAAAALMILLAGVSAGAQSLTKVGPGQLVFNSSVGLVPGQTLRVTVFNPGRVGQGGGGGGGSIKVAAPVYGASGDLLVRTAEVEIAEGGFHSFDINRDDIAAPGEPRTGRLQVRVEIVISTPPEGEANGNTYRGATVINGGLLEVIDSDSGKTTAVALLLPAIQSAREAARR